MFSELDAGVQELQTALARLKKYRQAVLHHYLNNPDWERVKLGEVAEGIDPQPSHRTPPVKVDGIPYVGYKDINLTKNCIDFDSARKVDQTVLEEHLQRYKLTTGDFVIGKIGTIGKPFKLPLPQTYTLSANVVLIKPKKINPSFLFNLFQSSVLEQQFRDEQRATTQAAFGIQKVKLMSIPLPDLATQTRIVEEIEARLSEADAMESTIRNELKRAENLRQSILKQAFAGKLVVENQMVL